VPVGVNAAREPKIGGLRRQSVFRNWRATVDESGHYSSPSRYDVAISNCSLQRPRTRHSRPSPLRLGPALLARTGPRTAIELSGLVFGANCDNLRPMKNSHADPGTAGRYDALTRETASPGLFIFGAVSLCSDPGQRSRPLYRLRPEAKIPNMFHLMKIEGGDLGLSWASRVTITTRITPFTLDEGPASMRRRR